MSGFFLRCLLALLIASATACGKSESPATVATTAPAKNAANTAAAPNNAPTETQAVATDPNAQKPADAETSPTERVAEVEEGAEAADEPPAKGAPVLKLAQV